MLGLSALRLSERIPVGGVVPRSTQDLMAATETDENATPSLSNDELYDVLADRRRRYAIHYLKQCREPVSVRELAEQVAAWENDKTVQALGSQERKRVYIALYQSHLPSMDDAGLVVYDEDASTVELGDVFEELDIYLEIVPKADVPWSLYYVGLAVANLLLLGLAWFEVAPFTSVPNLAWGAFVLVTFGVSAIVENVSSRRMRLGDDGPPPDLTSRDDD